MKAPGLPALFVYAALVFGSLFALLVPPFESPDEPNHFLRAYQVSEARFFPQKIEGRRLGGYLPASLQTLADSFHYLKNDYAARLPSGALRQAGQLPLQPERRVFLDFANTAIYAPIGYLPQALAMALLRPFGAGPLLLLYAARLANLFVWVGLVWASLRMLPALRRPVAALALLPASLVIAASANADVLINGLCFWLFASFCQPLVRDRCRQMLFFAAVCAAKLVTLPLGLLYGLQRKNHIFYGALLIIGLGSAIVWGRLAQSWFIPFDAYDPTYRATQTLNEDVQPAVQMRFLTLHSGFFMKVAAQSYARALPSTLAHFVGKFGWEKNYLPVGWLAALWIALLALFCCETKGWTVRQRILAWLIAAFFVQLFSITMYVLWCPVAATELSNLQGRYFVPIGPVVALALSNRWLAAWSRMLVPMALGLILLGNVAMVWAIWQRW